METSFSHKKDNTIPISNFKTISFTSDKLCMKTTLTIFALNFIKYLQINLQLFPNNITILFNLTFLTRKIIKVVMTNLIKTKITQVPVVVV